MVEGMEDSYRTLLRTLESHLRTAMNMRIAVRMYEVMLKTAPTVAPDEFKTEEDAGAILVDVPMGVPGVITEADQKMPIRRIMDIMEHLGAKHEGTLIEDIERLRKEPEYFHELCSATAAQERALVRAKDIQLYQRMFDGIGDGHLVPKRIQDFFGIDQVQVANEYEASHNRVKL